MEYINKYTFTSSEINPKSIFEKFLKIDNDVCGFYSTILINNMTIYFRLNETEKHDFLKIEKRFHDFSKENGLEYCKVYSLELSKDMIEIIDNLKLYGHVNFISTGAKIWFSKYDELWEINNSTNNGLYNSLFYLNKCHNEGNCDDSYYLEQMKAYYKIFDQSKKESTERIYDFFNQVKTSTKLITEYFKELNSI